ncbi:MAG TPA: biotin/lipoyl-containing protein, partial [Acidimicrobiales bacterium]|nr:biotin/lipoyl-containing protein [Acidimicrobiales bacterium]
GPVTNRDLLISILRHPDFAQGRTDTGFLERNPPDVLGAGRLSERQARIHAAAAALATQSERRNQKGGFYGFPSGWRNNPSQYQKVSFQADLGPIEVEYLLQRSGVSIRIANDIEFSFGRLELISAEPGEVVLEIDGIRRAFAISQYGNQIFVDSIFGASRLLEIPRFQDPSAAVDAGSLQSPMPGTVVRIDVSEGDQVEAGQTLLVIEAMKMEHAISAPFAGTIAQVLTKPGEQTEASAILVVLEQHEVPGSVSDSKTSPDRTQD